MSSGSRSLFPDIPPWALELPAWGVSWFIALMALVLTMYISGSGDPDRELYLTAVIRPLYGPTPADLPFPFLYSPVAVEVFRLLTWMPMNLFLDLFGLAGCVAVAWLVRPLGIRWAPQVFLIVLPVTLHGNLEWLFALVAVLALRSPVVWAIPLLTKVAPGVGAFWYVGRRDWRSFAVAVAVPSAIAAVSMVFDPALWRDWFAMLGRMIATGGMYSPLLNLPLQLRGPVALALVLWGGRTGRTWTIVVAMVLTRPDLSWSEFATLVALPRLLLAGREIGMRESQGVPSLIKAEVRLPLQPRINQDAQQRRWKRARPLVGATARAFGRTFHGTPPDGN